MTAKKQLADVHPEDVPELEFSAYGQLQEIRDKLVRLIDRAKHYGEHTQSILIFEEILEEVDVVIDHEERFY